MLNQVRFDGAFQRPIGRRAVATAAADRTQASAFGIEREQRLGHLRLHTQHFDEESECAQVGGQALDRAMRPRLLRVDAAMDQEVDILAHAQHGLRSVIEAEDGQHPSHGLQLVGHGNEHRGLGRLAEELVDELLGLRERCAQLVDHAAHRLAVGHAAVQLLHPRLERLGGGTVAHARDALRLQRILAITSPDNTASMALLDRLGFRFDRMVNMGDEELRLFVSDP